jgi:hypothetical protein
MITNEMQPKIFNQTRSLANLMTKGVSQSLTRSAPVVLDLQFPSADGSDLPFLRERDPSFLVGCSLGDTQAVERDERAIGTRKKPQSARAVAAYLGAFLVGNLLHASLPSPPLGILSSRLALQTAAIMAAYHSEAQRHSACSQPDEREGSRRVRARKHRAPSRCVGHAAPANSRASLWRRRPARTQSQEIACR